jgi:collagenase-like PrtC family protease
MAWMKQNVGRTLQDAIKEWEKTQKLQKDKSYKSEIPDSNQYNKYTRDFFVDNPEKTVQDARNFWKLKRKLPLGRHIYERTDLQLKEK